MKNILIIGASIIIALPSFAQTFKGDECTQDCSGHRAGYEWAERKGIDDASDCHGNSRSFNDGCVAYVEGR